MFIVPCSRLKHPELPVRDLPARDAYMGQAFRMCRRRLEHAGAQWCILSGLYGFLWPDTIIAYYDQKMEPVTAATDWEAFEELKQKQYGRLMSASRYVVLGSQLYATAARHMLGRPVDAPLVGLTIGRMLQRIKTGLWIH